MNTKDRKKESKFWMINRNIPLFSMVKEERKIMKMVKLAVVVVAY
jgi:hypothetical protein